MPSRPQTQPRRLGPSSVITTKRLLRNRTSTSLQLSTTTNASRPPSLHSPTQPSPARPSVQDKDKTAKPKTSPASECPKPPSDLSTDDRASSSRRRRGHPRCASSPRGLRWPRSRQALARGEACRSPQGPGRGFGRRVWDLPSCLAMGGRSLRLCAWRWLTGIGQGQGAQRG